MQICISSVICKSYIQVTGKDDHANAYHLYDTVCKQMIREWRGEQTLF